ncbi:MAG: hypothetical protein ACI8TP_001969 [Acidimicrobiales bacterium]|jgi:hypothetical protein
MSSNQAANQSDRTTARGLARVLGVFHNISYYAPEMKAFADVGLPEYWRAYIAYRSAPMGPVAPSVVTATFYNFAPRVVAAAVPSAWDGITPQGAIDLRDDCIDQALRRALGDLLDSADLREAAGLAMKGIDAAEVGARPLFAAHTELPSPNEPHRLLWHACTLWREHRGDSHNLALAAADIDGIECHVLLAAKGVGAFAVIEKIRGWTSAEWSDAVDRLVSRGFLAEESTADTPVFTPQGETLRQSIETETDRLASGPRRSLGPDDSSRLVALMEPVVGQLITSGAVPGRWPPPTERAPG